MGQNGWSTSMCISASDIALATVLTMPALPLGFGLSYRDWWVDQTGVLCGREMSSKLHRCHRLERIGRVIQAIVTVAAVPKAKAPKNTYAEKR